MWGPEERSRAAAAPGPATAKPELPNGKRGCVCQQYGAGNECHDLLTTRGAGKHDG